jgi:hypothetical protein
MDRNWRVVMIVANASAPNVLIVYEMKRAPAASDKHEATISQSRPMRSISAAIAATARVEALPGGTDQQLQQMTGPRLSTGPQGAS